MEKMIAFPNSRSAKKGNDSKDVHRKRKRERVCVREFKFRLHPLRSCHAMKPEFVTIPGHVRSK